MRQEGPAICLDKHRGSKRDLTNTGINFRPIPPINALYGLHCLSHDFTLSAKLGLYKSIPFS